MIRIIVATLLLTVPVATWGVVATVAYYRLRTRLRGLKEPELWLPKAERREHARKLLRREEEQWIQQQIERNTAFITERNDL